MSNFFQEAENAVEGFEGQNQGGNNNQGNQDSYGNSGNQQNAGGYDNERRENNNDNNQQDNQGGNNQQGSGQQSLSQSKGGFMGGAMQAGEDGFINTGEQQISVFTRNLVGTDRPAETNQFLTKEGVPAGMDGAIDAFVDKEANQFMGGNKNF